MLQFSCTFASRYRQSNCIPKRARACFFCWQEVGRTIFVTSGEAI